MNTRTPSSPLTQAVQNNAQWCDTVCRAHSIPGEFLPDLWLNRQQTPRFYPNAVMLLPTAQEHQAQLIYDRLAVTLPAQCAVKDSFCTLDLTLLGFEVLFTATWLWWDPSLPKPQSPTSVRWATIQTPPELAQWEMAWNGPPAVTEAAPLPRLFLPVQLADPTVSFIAAYDGDQLVAGAIANRTGEVVGVSNVFYPAQEAHAYWAGCVATILALSPSLPLVGYERGADLAIAQQLGFEAVGPLQIWVR